MSVPVSLSGRTALVTGAAGGIGSAVAALLAEAGALVIGVDRPGCGAVPGTRMLQADVSRPAEVKALFEMLAAEPHPPDILVHCAGIRADGVLWKMEDADWDQVLRVNLDSAFHLLKNAVPLLRVRGGAVVLISSINGERGKFGQANYAASKAGLIGLARTAARELGRFGVRVNVVAPGMIRTPMTEELPAAVVSQAAEESVLGRIGEPEDVAAAVLFLCSDMSRHITGQVVRVDGGQLIA